MTTLLKTSGVSKITLIAIIIVIFFIKLYNPQRNILSWDVFGFYLYLPATMIYNDPAIKDIGWVEHINSTYNNTETLYQISPVSNGGNIIRFSPGIAIMMSPFFILGHSYAFIEQDNPDGFSKPYQWAIILAGLFYTIIGLIFLRKILLRYLSDQVTAITLAILCLSSNLFFFITYGNDIPHVYAFTINVLIIWLTIRWHEDHKKSHAILLGLLLGLAVISRISEMIMVAIPVLWGVYNKQTLIDKVRLVLKYKRHLLYLMLAGIVAVLPQIIYWKVASGSWLYWSYTDPASSLNLLNPRFGWVLFGFRKGLFIYSPIMILSVFGFYHLYKKNKNAFVPLVIVAVLHTYLIASFTSLVAYGWRAFIELYAILAIPLAFFVTAVYKSKLWIRLSVLLVVLSITILNQFQIWQLNHGILDGYRMTREYYFRVFAKTRVTEEDRKYMLVQRSASALEKIPNEKDYNRKLLHHFDFESVEVGDEQYFDTTYSHSGEMSFRMDGTKEFSPTFRKAFNELSESYYGWVRASVWVYPVAEPAENEVVMVVAMRNGNRNYKYKGFSMNADTIQLKLNQWNLIRADYLTPELLSSSDQLEVYIWHKKGVENIWIDDLRIELFDPKQ